MYLSGTLRQPAVRPGSAILISGAAGLPTRPSCLWPGSIGSGDIKLALALAPGCPGWGAWTMAVTSFGLAALVALFYRFRTGKTIIPFGPFLLAGWWLAQEPLQRAWPGGWLW